jgi:succinylglutamic semialdehyde dehydrogenase
MARAWQVAGLPEGVLNLVQGARETGAALVAGDIDGLLFTGSAAAGLHFRSALAERPHVIAALELGGNNPLILWDGDTDEAASIAVQSGFITTGQRCSCARRLIVPQGATGEAMIDAIVALMDRLRIGAWDETPEAYMGPLVSAAAARLARERFAALGGKAIRPLAGIPGRAETFVTPALIDMTGIEAPDDEIFAPVLQIVRVSGFDAAVAAANATRFGLSAGLVTGDDALWQRFLLESRAGVINRNRPTTGAAGAMPFGGTGESGNHRPSAYYAADYCAYPVATFEAASAAGNAETIARLVRA